MAITHSYVSTVSDGTATNVVRPSDWNAGHVMTNSVTLLNKTSGVLDIVNDNTERDIYIGTIPAGGLGSDGLLRVTLGGDMYNAAGANQTYTFKVKLNGGTIYNDASGNIATLASRRPWRYEMEIQNLGTSNQQCMIGDFSISQGGPTTTGYGDYATTQLRDMTFMSAGSVSYNLANAATLQVTVTLGSANANWNFRRFIGVAEIMV